MPRNTRVTPSKEVDQLMAELQAYATTNPHTAVFSSNSQFKTNFYNVYLNDGAENFIQSLFDVGFEAYELLQPLTALGFTIKLIPRNKHGFCQCTISRAEGVDGRNTDTLTGEAGKMQMAIVVAVLKCLLIASYTPEGDMYWNSRRLNTVEERGFR